MRLHSNVTLTPSLRHHRKVRSLMRSSNSPWPQIWRPERLASDRSNWWIYIASLEAKNCGPFCQASRGLVMTLTQSSACIGVPTSRQCRRHCNRSGGSNQELLLSNCSCFAPPLKGLPYLVHMNLGPRKSRSKHQRTVG